MGWAPEEGGGFPISTDDRKPVRASKAAVREFPLTAAIPLQPELVTSLDWISTASPATVRLLRTDQLPERRQRVNDASHFQGA